MTGGRDDLRPSRPSERTARAQPPSRARRPAERGRGGGERAGLALVLTPNRAASSAESEEL